MRGTRDSHRVDRRKGANAEISRVTEGKHSALPAKQAKRACEQNGDQHLIRRVEQRRREDHGERSQCHESKR